MITGFTVILCGVLALVIGALAIYMPGAFEKDQ